MSWGDVVGTCRGGDVVGTGRGGMTWGHVLDVLEVSLRGDTPGVDAKFEFLHSHLKYMVGATV